MGYRYDAVGNRTSKALIGLSEGQPMGSVITDLSYASDSNRLVSVNGLGVSSDATGSLTRYSNNRTFEYDAHGRLAKVKVNSNLIAQYRYNALGQRTHKITGTATTTFLYGPNGQLLGETQYSPTGVKLGSQFYLWLDSLPLGGITLAYDADGGIASSSAFYLHADHLNTPRLATNQSGNEVWRWKSDAFGVGAAAGTATINLRFPGQYYDSESGLHYNYFRDYDPETGRYVESDPIGLAGGLNSYEYVEGNPLTLIDPDGLRGVPASSTWPAPYVPPRSSQLSPKSASGINKTSSDSSLRREYKKNHSMEPPIFPPVPPPSMCRMECSDTTCPAPDASSVSVSMPGASCRLVCDTGPWITSK